VFNRVEYCICILCMYSRFAFNCSLLYTHKYLVTSRFWPRVRARALRAPVFLGSLPRPTGRCAPPPRPSQLRCFLFDPKKYLQSIELGPPTSRAFFFPKKAMKNEVPCPRPAHSSFADPSGNILVVKLCFLYFNCLLYYRHAY
jgi:hypothetical protein